MTSPLVKHLRFDGMTYYINNIILVQSANILHLGNHTKRYLQEIAAQTRSLPYKSQPISLEEYAIEANRLRE